MTRPFAVLHLTAPSRVGGLERVVSALATGHARAGHAVHVAAVAGNADEAEAFLSPLAQQGVRTHRIIVPSRAYFRERAMIRALCREVQPSVVHTHGYRSDVIGSGVARALRIPRISTTHGFTYGSWRNRLYEALQVRALRSFEGVVAVSQPLVDFLRSAGVPADRLHLVVNAWSADQPLVDRDAARARLGIPRDARCIGWVGRLSHEKGADVLLDAVPHIDPQTMICFVGDGPERPALEARAAALGASSRIVWAGIVEHAGAFLGAFDAFVLSSRTEGTPIALFEAMGADLPVVATRVGGVPSVVGSDGALLVAPEDPRALASAVDLLFQEPLEAKRRAAFAARRLAEHYSVEPWLAAYETLYRQVSRR